LLDDDRIKQLFLTILEETRQRYRFCVYGYVIMPEHFHLLISRPESKDTGIVLQVLKQRISHQARNSLDPTLSQHRGKDGAPTVLEAERSIPFEDLEYTPPWQFWQRRFYASMCVPDGSP
jgi:REP element-mobilizing transposase RayT